MKKALIFTISILLLCSLCTGCHRDEAQVVATTLPVYDFTTALCKNTGISVARLITENVACLHDYTVQVSQMRAVEAAEAVVISGAGLEESLADIIQNSTCVIDASAGITLTCGHEHEGHEHTHDPHIWLSPENAKQMCNAICAQLSTLYPAHKNIFNENLTDILQQLDALQAYGENSLSGLACGNLITFHDGFSYFADSFGLNILQAVEEESGSEASAKELISLIELVEVNRLPAIFTETNGSVAAAEIIAKETGARIYSLDMAMSGDSYFDAMYHNIDTIKEALE